MAKSLSMPATPRRDRWGRYLIPHPEGLKEKNKIIEKAHTRVTTIAGTIENRHHLELWGKRMVALGLASRKDIYAAIAAVDDPESDEGKRALNDICERAFEAAGGGARADIGTALHAYTAMYDVGKTPVVPEPYDLDVDLYLETTKAKNILIEEIEVIGVKWGQWAGTMDQICRIGNRLIMVDKKTGKDVKKFAAGSIAIQLSCYVDSETLYDPGTGRHRPMPDVDKDHGLVIHLPAGENRVHLYWVDLHRGREGRRISLEARAWRDEKGGEGFTEWSDSEPQESTVARRQNFLARQEVIKSLPGGLENLRRSWPADLPTLKASDDHTTAQLDQVDHILGVVEGRLRAPFGAPDPGSTRHLSVVKGGG